MNKDLVRDRLLNVSPIEVSRASMAVINALQDYPNEVQLAAVGYTFSAYLELTKQHAGNVLDTVGNIKREQDKIRPEFSAVEKYLQSIL